MDIHKYYFRFTLSLTAFTKTKSQQSIFCSLLDGTVHMLYEKQPFNIRKQISSHTVRGGGAKSTHFHICRPLETNADRFCIFGWECD